jgi:hypothetical protein
MSVGCENGVFPAKNQNPGGPTCYIGSYIDIAFQDYTLNTQNGMVDLATGYGRTEAEAWNVFNAQCRMMATTFKKMFDL